MAARLSFQKAVELQPGNANASYAWAAQLLDELPYREATGEGTQVERAKRTDPAGWLMLKFRASARLCRRALEIDPGHLRSWSVLGIAQRRMAWLLGNDKAGLDQSLDSHRMAAALACRRLFTDFDNPAKKRDAVWAMSNLAVCQVYRRETGKALATRSLLRLVDHETTNDRFELAKALAEERLYGKAAAIALELSMFDSWMGTWELSKLLEQVCSPNPEGAALLTLAEKKFLRAAEMAREPAGADRQTEFDEELAAHIRALDENPSQEKLAAAETDPLLGLLADFRNADATSANGLLAAAKLSPAETLLANGSALRAVKRNPFDPWRRSVLGLSLFRLGTFDRAGKQWLLSADLDTGEATYAGNVLSVSLQNSRGPATGERRKAVEAAAEFGEARLDETIDDSQANRLRFQLAQVYRHLGQYERAATYFSECAQRGFTPVQGRFFAGMCYLDLKRFDQALFEFRAGLEALNTGPPAGREHEDMAPHRGFALMYLGHALTWAERNARLNEALKYCLKAKAAFAGKQGAAEETDDDLRAALHEVTGWVQFRRGELHQAEAELAAALGLTEDATCQYRLAACLALRAAKSKDEDERAEVIGRARLHASLARAIVSASGGPPWLASELDHVEESLKALGAAARSEPVRP